MYKIYQVEYGDTIDKIAQKTNTTSDNIKNINSFAICENKSNIIDFVDAIFSLETS